MSRPIATVTAATGAYKYSYKKEQTIRRRLGQANRL